VKICLADNVGFINYYFATGLALLVVSGRKLGQTLRALSDKEKYESLYIKEHDEWNTLTLLKATYYAFATAALLSYVLSLVLLFTDSVWFPPFVAANAIYAAFYVFYIIVMRKTIKENMGEENE
jgi:hypothetical protein